MATEFVPDEKQPTVEPPKGPLGPLPTGAPRQMVHGYPIAQPGEKPLEIPSPLSYLFQNLKRNWPQVAGDVAAAALPGGFFATLPRRLGTQAAISGGTEALRGGSPGSIAGHAALGAGVGTVAEGLALPFRLNANAKVFAQKQVEQRAAEEGWKAKKAFDEQVYKGLKALEDAGFKKEAHAARDLYAKQLKEWRSGRTQTLQTHAAQVAAQETAHTAAVGKHAEQAASQIADNFKAQVSAWNSYPSDTKGLLEMVYGKGQAALSEKFDKAMADVAKAGAGKMITLPIKALNELGIDYEGKVGAGVKGEVLEDAVVDAAKAAEGTLGKWKTNPGAYRQIVGALDKAGVGDPVARGEYKAGQALIEFIDKTKALEGETLHPDRLLAGMTSLKKLGEIRKRGQGDIFTGPMQAARGAPMSPGKIPDPTIPPQPVKGPGPSQVSQLRQPITEPKPEMDMRQFKVRQNVLSGHPLAMGLSAEALSAGSGLGHGFGMPFMGGYALSQTMPKQLVTRAPLPSGLQQALRDYPWLAALFATQQAP